MIKNDTKEYLIHYLTGAFFKIVSSILKKVQVSAKNDKNTKSVVQLRLSSEKAHVYAYLYMYWYLVQKRK